MQGDWNRQHNAFTSHLVPASLLLIRCKHARVGTCSTISPSIQGCNLQLKLLQWSYCSEVICASFGEISFELVEVCWLWPIKGWYQFGELCKCGAHVTRVHMYEDRENRWIFCIICMHRSVRMPSFKYLQNQIGLQLGSRITPDQAQLSLRGTYQWEPPKKWILAHNISGLHDESWV